jgi:hypothetical protein
VAPLAAADHADLRQCEQLEFGPGFALSRALGGADADLIADGTLLDLKATSTAAIVKRPELSQLVGYALADSGDTYGIRRVGVSAVRWRTRYVWDLHDLLGRLAGGPLPVEQARAELAETAERARYRPGAPADLTRVRAQRL